ncbi:MAG: hypothetical protein LUQ29_11785 [Methylococcaceae bacterium]|jgi:mRNA interferase HicA|nr:hypothetical protein [Methylococcaceae bacterium]MDD1643931.1 hypothetical protein [Methylococcaceae bacterium]
MPRFPVFRFIPYGLADTIDPNNTVTVLSMNSKQKKKWLKQQSVTFQAGKGCHLMVFLNGKQSALPMHGTAELGKGLEAAIKRQLGLKLGEICLITPLS